MPAVDLAASQSYCLRVARRAARNFYYGFYPLSDEQHVAMCAVYAFARRSDDITDEEGPADRAARRQALQCWRAALDAALSGDYGDDPVLPALHHAVGRFSIPPCYLHELIDGVAIDLAPPRYQTFDDLYRYCYLVASTVGLICLHIFGFDSTEAPALAEKMGIAFQLTNILRDLREDLGRGRLYLPAEDLERFGVAPADFQPPRLDRLRPLLAFEADRAEHYYAEAAPLLDLVHARSRASLWILATIYHHLLEHIRAAQFDVFSRRVRLSTVGKSLIMLRGVKSHLTGGRPPFPA
jgi:phytoene synthase